MNVDIKNILMAQTTILLDGGPQVARYVIARIGIIGCPNLQRAQFLVQYTILVMNFIFLNLTELLLQRIQGRVCRAAI